jgi:hypothetical protein
MLIQPEQVAELLEQVSHEGYAQIQWAPLSTMPNGLQIPQTWRELLVRDDAAEQITAALWTSAQAVLPAIIAQLRRVTQAVGLLTTDRGRPSLIYAFTKDGEIFARRGFVPNAHMPPIHKNFAIDLSPFYRVHDGWIDLFSGDTGFLPMSEWQTIGTDGENNGFLEVFVAGGNSIGFDLSERPAGSYVLWADEDVARLDDFWAKIDLWISDELKEMDPNGRKA